MWPTTSKRTSNTTCDLYHEQIMTTASLTVLRIEFEEVSIVADDSYANPTVGTVLHNDNFGRLFLANCQFLLWKLQEKH